MGCSDRDVSDLVEELHGPQELQLWNLHSIRHHHGHGHVKNLVQELPHRRPPRPPSPSTIREPTLELPGAALD